LIEQCLLVKKQPKENLHFRLKVYACFYIIDLRHLKYGRLEFAAQATGLIDTPIAYTALRKFKHYQLSFEPTNAYLQQWIVL
jgi:hypothetical protein